jgi:hypothetical protein
MAMAETMTPGSKQGSATPSDNQTSQVLSDLVQQHHRLWYQQVTKQNQPPR